MKVFYLIVACKPGYHGRYCTDFCRYPNYGPLCQEGCNCSKDYCHHITGCLNSSTIFIACFSSAKLMLLFVIFILLFSLKWKKWILGHLVKTSDSLDLFPVFLSFKVNVVKSYTLYLHLNFFSSYMTLTTKLTWNFTWIYFVTTPWHHYKKKSYFIFRYFFTLNLI